MEILRNVAPVSPEVVLSKIEAELSGPNGARILSTENRQRGQWISLIKTLGYDAPLFEDAAFALARFVAVEPEGHNYNSAERYFGELFQLHLSGTQAIPEARRDVIRRMAASEDTAIRNCAARALDSLLEASHFTSLSLHDFGARPRDFGWQPQTYGEIWNWYNDGVALAIELSATLPATRKVLADNVRGIWRHVRCQDALDAASVELTRDGPWIEGWIGFRQALAYDAASMPAEIRERLTGIVERLRPTDLLNRARAIVLARSGGGFDILEGVASSPSEAWRLADQQAVDLGRAFANEPGRLVTFLSEVFAERSPHRAVQFGRGLAEGAANVEELWATLLATFKEMPVDGRNATVLGGYIHGASENPEFVTAALDGVAEDPEVVRDLTYLQARAGIDRGGITRLSAALDAGKIDPALFRHLASGVVAEAPGEALATLLTKLATLPGRGSVALEILYANFVTKDEGREHDAHLIASGREILATGTFADGSPLGDYYVGEVVKVCLAGPDGEEAARTVCRRVREGLDDYSLSAYRIAQFLKALFNVQPTIALDTFLLGDDGDIEIWLERRSPLNEMDVAVLRGWADLDPQTRYPLIGRLELIFEVSDLDDVVGLSSRFVELMEHAPDRLAFLGGASNRLYPSGWSGSLADVLERRRAMLEPLADHQDPAVRGWLDEIDVWLAERIASERRRDAEREESFE